MNNDVLISEITRWNTVLTTRDSDLYELAFFKIFIKFEKFLSDVFENYSIGVPSAYGYCPDRILCFKDIDHLNKILKKENKSFVNHYESIRSLSDCIFLDNPFEIITRDMNYTTELNNMKILRDYIAHESESSKNKYIKSLLNNGAFISPNDYLIKRKKNLGISNYTHFTNLIREVSSFLINNPLKENVM